MADITDRYIHILRNPWGAGAEEMRDARLWACDQIDDLRTLLGASIHPEEWERKCQEMDALRDHLAKVTDALESRLGTNADEWAMVRAARKALEG